MSFIQNPQAIINHIKDKYDCTCTLDKVTDLESIETITFVNKYGNNISISSYDLFFNKSSEILTRENLVLKIFSQSVSEYHFRYHSENIFSVDLDTLSVKFTDSVSTPYLDSNRRLFLNENGKIKIEQKINKTILYPVSEYSQDLLTLFNFYSFEDLLSEFGTKTMNHWLTPFKDFTTTYFIENDNIVSYLNEGVSNYILKDKNLLGRNIEKEIDEYKEILSRE